MKIKNSSSKRYLFIGLFAIICAVAVSGNLYLLNKSKARISDPQSATYEYNWYFNPRNDGKQPEPIKEASFFSKYNSYYVGDPNEKVIYLTFDAGYENGTTESILDTLKKHNVKAHFFVVESYIRNNPELIKRMVNEGHLVCNHSKNHLSMAQITDFEKFKSEITGVEDAYKELIGKDMPKYFRPPMGKFSEQSLKYTQDLGYSSIFWSFAYVDWYNDKQPTHEYAKDKIYTRTHPGAIVLLHPNSKTNTEILDEVITHWKEEGYSFAIQLFRILAANKDICAALMGPNGDMAFVEKIEKLVEDAVLPELFTMFPQNVNDIKYAYAFCINGCVGMIKCWLTGDSDDTPEHMAYLTHNIISEAPRNFAAKVLNSAQERTTV